MASPQSFPSQTIHDFLVKVSSFEIELNQLRMLRKKRDIKRYTQLALGLRDDLEELFCALAAVPDHIYDDDMEYATVLSAIDTVLQKMTHDLLVLKEPRRLSEDDVFGIMRHFETYTQMTPFMVSKIRLLFTKDKARRVVPDDRFGGITNHSVSPFGVAAPSGKSTNAPSTLDAGFTPLMLSRSGTNKPLPSAPSKLIESLSSTSSSLSPPSTLCVEDVPTRLRNSMIYGDGSKLDLSIPPPRSAIRGISLDALFEALLAPPSQAEPFPDFTTIVMKLFRRLLSPTKFVHRLRSYYKKTLNVDDGNAQWVLELAGRRVRIVRILALYLQQYALVRDGNLSYLVRSAFLEDPMFAQGTRWEKLGPLYRPIMDIVRIVDKLGTLHQDSVDYYIVTNLRALNDRNPEMAPLSFDVYAFYEHCVKHAESWLSRDLASETGTMEFARQLTVQEYAHYRNLSLDPLNIVAKWLGREASILHSTPLSYAEIFVDRFIQFETSIFKWAVDSILSQPSAQRRGRYMGFWINVAMCCRQMQNYGTMRAIYSALISTYINRMKESQLYVPVDAKEKWEELREICEPHAKTYREELRNSTKPCIPLLFVIAHDLTQISEIPLWLSKGGKKLPKDANKEDALINWNALQQIMTVVRTLERCREIEYKIPECWDLQQFISAQTHSVLKSYPGRDAVHLEAFWQRSLAVEPRRPPNDEWRLNDNYGQLRSFDCWTLMHDGAPQRNLLMHFSSSPVVNSTSRFHKLAAKIRKQ
ncbi:ras GEF [Fistulina hepatica ATCC 64428]|uniref:Ras GEF n=1 Tax=Fistulina hepatica ATCC 64428 TaxID=1128425 RepID=A0A0D7A4A1_9AGAR|nr:ras GEF [Fistulina hepatica ATCC 64428]